MYKSMNCAETTDYFKKQGLVCGWVYSFLLAGYSPNKKESFTFKCFTASLSNLSLLDQKRAFSIAASCGHYLIPIAEKVSEDFGRRERKTFLAWMPEEFLATTGTYLADFEKVVKASYDYLQEDDAVTQFADDLEVLRGHFEYLENNRKQLYAAVAGPDTMENNNLLAEHFRGHTKVACTRLVRLIESLESQWNDSCPHWETWKEAINREWHVVDDAESPLRNFGTFVEHMKQRDVMAEPWFGL